MCAFGLLTLFLEESGVRTLLETGEGLPWLLWLVPLGGHHEEVNRTMNSAESLLQNGESN